MVGLVANRKRKRLKAILLFFYVHHDIMQTFVKRIPKIIREIPTFFSGLAPPLEITHDPQGGCAPRLRANDIGQISKIVNVHLIDLKFEEDLHIMSVNSTPDYF